MGDLAHCGNNDDAIDCDVSLILYTVINSCNGRIISFGDSNVSVRNSRLHFSGRVVRPATQQKSHQNERCLCELAGWLAGYPNSALRILQLE